MNKNQTVIECRQISKIYNDGYLEVTVLDQLDLMIERGQSVSIVGSSGSGKSTLLHILGGLDTCTSGEVSLMGQSLSDLSQAAIGRLRNQYLGFVYQFHHLLPEFTALENVMMPLLISRIPKEQARIQATEMLDKVGLQNRLAHRPAELSGGERQRAAIARALVTRPACVLADEPTGNLDYKNARNILDMMLDLQTELDSSLVVVTHDDELARHFDRVLTVTDGRLISL